MSVVNRFPVEVKMPKWMFDVAGIELGVLLLPTILIAVVQSYRLFRRELPDNTFSILRHLLVVCAVAYLVALAFQVPLIVVFRDERMFFSTLDETHEAVGKLGLDPSTLDAANPKQFAGTDVARSTGMSGTASRLLRDATINVVPKSGDPNWFVKNKVQTQYFTIIHFRNNWECTTYGGRKDISRSI